MVLTGALSGLLSVDNLSINIEFAKFFLRVFHYDQGASAWGLLCALGLLHGRLAHIFCACNVTSYSQSVIWRLSRPQSFVARFPELTADLPLRSMVLPS